MVTSSEASKFIYRDESVPPLTPFEVKVGVYNNKGDGPFSQIVVICSAEGGQFVYPYYLIQDHHILCGYLNNENPCSYIRESESQHKIKFIILQFIYVDVYGFLMLTETNQYT